MAHHIYHTKGIVLGSAFTGEANAIKHILTEDLGLVHARAQGIRLLQSKLRFSLQPLSLVTLSLVHGRTSWRIVNAVEIHNFYQPLRVEKEKLALATRVLSLLDRLLRGEEKNETLFADVAQALSFLASETLSPNELSAAECTLVLKILRRLGYLGSQPEFELAVESPLSREVLQFLAPLRSRAVLAINTSLRETQL